MSDHFDLLISAYLDDELDDAGLAELEAWLDADRDHRRRFLRMTHAHRALLDRSKAQAAASDDASTARAMAAADAQQAATATGAWRARSANQARPSARLRGMSARRRAVPTGTRPWMLAAAMIAAALVVATVADHGAGPQATRDVAHQAAPTPGRATQPTPAHDVAGVAVVAAANDATLDGKSPLAPGATLADGARIVVGPGGAVALRCPDGTALRADADSEFTIAEPAAGKRVQIARGRVAADVSPQPAGRPLILATGGADVTVVGTSLAVASLGDETRAEVTHGRITLTRRADGASVAIAAGQYAICAEGAPLTAHAFGEASGTTYEVGAGARYQRFADLPALAPGDVVAIRPGTYRESCRWHGDGTPLRPITVRGAGPDLTIIDGDGVSISGVGAEPRALFQIEGSHWAIEGLAFVHARHGDQASAIRTIPSTRGIAIRDVRASDCNRGFDVVGDDMRIADCAVSACGVEGGDGSSHGIATSGARVVIERCDVHDIVGGQGVRCVGGTILIADSRIARATDGELTIGHNGEGSDVAVVGCLLRGGGRRNGSYTRFIVIEPEGETRCSLRLVGDTFVAADARTIFVTGYGHPVQAHADGCVFVGSDKLTDTPSLALSGREDWLPAGVGVPPGMADALRGDDPGFVDAAGDDFRLRADSPCVGRGPIALVAPGFPAVERVAAPGAGAMPVADQRRWLGAFAPR